MRRASTTRSGEALPDSGAKDVTIRRALPKFENSQRKLQQTQEALVDAKDKIKQAQYTIKERDFIISKFQQSEDALVKQAGILQSQLENCITDVTGLHLKIDRKSKVETDNHHTLQTFQGDLGQQLKALEGSVTASIEQQQQHLQHMQGQVESLMASKNKVVEALRQNAMSVKEIYFSGLRGIHDLLHSHEKDSTSTFQKVNLTISAHSTALQELLSAAVSEAETLFQDLQNAFIRQQDVISSLICQQQEKVQQSVDAAKQISKKLVAFYLLQEQSATEISGSVLDSHKNLYQTLMDLKEAYEELSKQEEQTLIERIAEMVAAASARKSEIVNSKVSVLRESIITNSDCLQHDVHRMCEARTESQSLWQVYIKEAENHFNQVSASFASSQSCLEDAVGHCIKRTTEAGEGWKKAQLSVRQLEKNNHLAVDLIIKEGVYGNGRLLSTFEEMNDSVESDVQLGNSILMESIDGCLQVDVDATTAMLTTVATQTQTLTELQVCHSMETCDIQSQADLCFNNEYLEDKPTGLTPMKRPIHLTNKALIEALRVPGIEKLVQEFRDVTHLSSPEKDAAATQRDMAVKESKIPIFAESSLLKDNRAPLTAVN